MRTTLIAAAGLVLALSGSAMAQSATGNMNNPGSVKSNSEKSMDTGTMNGGAMNRGEMPATTGTTPGASTTVPGTRDSGNMGAMPSTNGAAPAR